MCEGARGESMKQGVYDAVNAMTDLCEAINSNKLSIKDLIEGCNSAIESGHYMAQINLAMMSNAIAQSIEHSEKCLKS